MAENEFTFDSKDLLYEGDGFQVYTSPRDMESHEVVMDGTAHMYLDRAILRDIAENTPLGQLEATVDRLNSRFAGQVRDSKNSFEDFYIAVARARMRELNDEVSYFAGQVR